MSATESEGWSSKGFHGNKSHCIFHHSIGQCLISRLTCLCFLVVVTFLICLTQEFTFILTFRSYMTTTTMPKDSAMDSSKRKLHEPKMWANGINSNEVNDWRKITEEIYVYSAYWESRLGNASFVRIIGGAKIVGENLNNLKCLFLKSKIHGIYKEIPSTYEVLIEHHKKPCKAVYIMCSSYREKPPEFVALVPNMWNSTWRTKPQWIAVNLLEGNKEPSGIGVCVRPLFNYTDIFRVVEFIAFYEALGVTHFTFYRYEIANDINRLIEEARNANYSLEMLPWSLPQELSSMWALGQMASINDCIYRQMRSLAYVVVVDFDEFITPRHAITLQQLLSSHDIPEKKSASFVFRSCVFCIEYERDIFPDEIPPFITQTSIRRESTIYPFLVRTKYVVKPRRMVTSGVHHVWELLPGWEERLVPASHVLVHHYRAQLCTEGKKKLKKGEVDVMARKYLNQMLRSKIVSVWKRKFPTNIPMHVNFSKQALKQTRK